MEQVLQLKQRRERLLRGLRLHRRRQLFSLIRGGERRRGSLRVWADEEPHRPLLPPDLALGGHFRLRRGVPGKGPLPGGEVLRQRRLQLLGGVLVLQPQHNDFKSGGPHAPDNGGVLPRLRGQAADGLYVGGQPVRVRFLVQAFDFQRILLPGDGEDRLRQLLDGKLLRWFGYGRGRLRLLPGVPASGEAGQQENQGEQHRNGSFHFHMNQLLFCRMLYYSMGAPRCKPSPPHPDTQPNRTKNAAFGWLRGRKTLV